MIANIFRAAFCAAILLVLFSAGCSGRPEAESVQAYLEAQKAFEKAESLPSDQQDEAFRRVAARYRGLIDQGIRSGPIYYNLGNAWMRCNEPGRALAAYLTARRYMPLDPHIASNIQTVLGGATVDEAPTPILEHLFFWQDWLGVKQKAWSAMIMAVVTFVAAVLGLYVRHRRIRRFTVAMLLLTLLAVGSTGYDWYRFEYLKHAVVATDQALPRKGNSEQYELSFTTPVTFGTVTTVLDRRGDWVRLRFGSGQDGWLPENQIVEY